MGRPWTDSGCKEAGSTGCEDEPLYNLLRLEVGELGATAGDLPAETASSQPVTCWGRGGGDPCWELSAHSLGQSSAEGRGGSKGSLSTAPVRAAGPAGARLQHLRNLLPRFSRADKGTRGRPPFLEESQARVAPVSCERTARTDHRLVLPTATEKGPELGGPLSLRTSISQGCVQFGDRKLWVSACWH